MLKSFWFSFFQKGDGVGRGNAPAPAEQILAYMTNVEGFTPNTPDNLLQIGTLKIFSPVFYKKLAGSVGTESLPLRSKTKLPT